MNGYPVALMLFFTIIALNNQCNDVPTIALQDLMQKNLGIHYQLCDDQHHFNFEPFTISPWPHLQPSQGILQETFILTIPQGCTYSASLKIPGLIVTDYGLVEELMWPSAQRFMRRHSNFTLNHLPEPTKIPGRLAVIAQEGKAYAHWMIETLGRLALLEMHNIAYDYLYVSMDQRFKQETLQLWGIDLKKVIEPTNSTKHVQADELLVPSLVGRKYPPLNHEPLFCLYIQPWLLEFVRNKFLSVPMLQEINRSQFSKKVFISRKDTTLRRILNEDEIFALFANEGFERYELSKMSFLEQVSLFNNADTIVAFHGSGLTNIMFCKPQTQIIEFFQSRGDCTFWYLSQLLNLKHQCIKTIPFDLKNSMAHTSVPISIAKQVVNSL